MRKLLTRAFALGCVASLTLAACGDDEGDDGSAGNGGTGGTAGAAGSGGKAGSSGSGGGGGTAGASGSGGNAGSGGSGGTSGAGGGAGSSGTGGGAGSDGGSDAGVVAQVVPCTGDIAVTINAVEDGASFEFSPATGTIEPGEVVRFRNQTEMGHTATSGDGGQDPGVPDGIWDTGNIAADSSKCVRINVVGSYPFYCTPHPVSMTGQITVED
ncbi:MAG TPA: plastocyanin/azurin family copper-binding protein [Polyangiaceae bacterium]|nr:plastocyanin/azurin family copper-binding protein [Polyangiaceae bacterium]